MWPSPFAEQSYRHRERLGHISSIQDMVAEKLFYPHLVQRFEFDIEELAHAIRRLSDIKSGVPFSLERADWTVRLLRRRYQRLLLVLNMRTINKIMEPNRLLLTWQPTTGGTRFVVGQIDRQANNVYTFKYHFGSNDFLSAQAKGFMGHPAFAFKNEVHTNNVLDPFVRRLPPRKRKDFAEYLAQHLLPYPFTGSDFALLAYTGAKSPGDGFCLTPDPPVINGEAELLLEVAGTRYQSELDLSLIKVGDLVSLTPEPGNPVDPDAIAVTHPQGKLGYINKVFCNALQRKIIKGKVSALVAKINGTKERPLIYLLIECSE